VTEATAARRSWRSGSLLLAVGVLSAYAATGLGAGWMWHELWQSSDGVVFQHDWYADGDALRQDFSGTALYVLVAAGCGLVLAAVLAFVAAARPVLLVVLCVAGSVLAAWLMLRLGEWLGPTDPHQLAKTADDGTHLPSALRVSGFPPLLAFSAGSLAAVGVVFGVIPGKRSETRFNAEPRR
jgi:hypothetical protein